MFFIERIVATTCLPVLFRNKNKVHTFRFRRSRRRVVRTFRNKKGTNVKAYVKLSLYHIVVILFFKMKVSLSILKTSKEETITKKKRKSWKLYVNGSYLSMKVFLSCPSRITTLAYTSWISSSKSTQIPDLIFPNLRALEYLAFYLLIMYKKYFKHWSRQLKHT